MKFLVAVVIFTVFAGICCEAGRIKGKEGHHHHQHGGKWEKKKGMVPLACLKPDTAEAQHAKLNESRRVCFAEMKNSTGEAPTMDKENKDGMKKWHKEHGMCVMSCMWQRLNVLKVSNGTGQFNATGFAEFSSMLIEDAGKAFTMQLNACAQHKGLSLNATVGSNCEGLQKYGGCWKHSIEVACNPEKRALALSGKGMVNSFGGSDETSDDSVMSSTSSSPSY
ncbi:unnamed protein product [Allacma fusca]|uniref:Uncharacterized protein n=1 Tax=Allacma fusca TaxID=39272 RepID=A0A8J2PW41_9HEXA|nr:unnamed protein product [Allacma fusca]